MSELAANPSTLSQNIYIGVMKLNDATVVPAFQKLAQSWDMTLLERVAETGRAYVFKVRGQRGTAALKLYKRFGASGEGAGVHFLRNLAPDIGVQIQRSSVLRSAVLMGVAERRTSGRIGRWGG